MLYGLTFYLLVSFIKIDIREKRNLQASVQYSSTLFQSSSFNLSTQNIWRACASVRELMPHYYPSVASWRTCTSVRELMPHYYPSVASWRTCTSVRELMPHYYPSVASWRASASIKIPSPPPSLCPQCSDRRMGESAYHSTRTRFIGISQQYILLRTSNDNEHGAIARMLFTIIDDTRSLV